MKLVHPLPVQSAVQVPGHEVVVVVVVVVLVVVVGGSVVVVVVVLQLVRRVSQLPAPLPLG